MKHLHQFNSISKFHKYCHLPSPEHPLISVIDYSQVIYPTDNESIRWVQNFYSIGLKRNVSEKFNYGQQKYDFDEGVFTFVAPEQILRIEMNQNVTSNPSGWLLLIHPDLLWHTPLANHIKNYAFFGYSVNEALFLSEKEERVIAEILKNIKQEYQSTIDKFSANIIISQIELLLNYAERYYERQFITRKITNHLILSQLENLLADCFKDEILLNHGTPTVKQVADRLHLSPNYLANVLKALTGQSTQQHIHNKLIDKAKTKLSTTELSISEIAYGLGFEHATSFSKLFKSKTNSSPVEFRNSFN